jgi:hypothetical protein
MKEGAVVAALDGGALGPMASQAVTSWCVLVGKEPLLSVLPGCAMMSVLREQPNVPSAARVGIWSRFDGTDGFGQFTGFDLISLLFNSFCMLLSHSTSLTSKSIAQMSLRSCGNTFHIPLFRTISGHSPVDQRVRVSAPLPCLRHISPVSSSLFHEPLCTNLMGRLFDLTQHSYLRG